MTSGFADHVEREARRILRQLIERLPWYPRMSPSEREAAIKADVDRYWRIMHRINSPWCAPACSSAFACRWVKGGWHALADAGSGPAV